jgi:phosphoglycolate phosphatase
MNGALPSCLLFDLDWTLLDSLPGIEYSVRAACESCPLPPPQMSLRGLIGPPIRTILSQLASNTDSETLTALESTFRGNYDKEGWQMTVCYPDATRVLQTLHEHRHRLFVISNKPRHISLQILMAEGISDLFEAVVTRDSRLPHYTGR